MPSSASVPFVPTEKEKEKDRGEKGENTASKSVDRMNTAPIGMVVKEKGKKKKEKKEKEAGVAYSDKNARNGKAAADDYALGTVFRGEKEL